MGKRFSIYGKFADIELRAYEFDGLKVRTVYRPGQPKSFKLVGDVRCCFFASRFAGTPAFKFGRSEHREMRFCRFGGDLRGILKLYRILGHNAAAKGRDEEEG